MVKLESASLPDSHSPPSLSLSPLPLRASVLELVPFPKVILLGLSFFCPQVSGGPFIRPQFSPTAYVKSRTRGEDGCIPPKINTPRGLLDHRIVCCASRPNQPHAKSSTAEPLLILRPTESREIRASINKNGEPTAHHAASQRD